MARETSAFETAERSSSRLTAPTNRKRIPILGKSQTTRTGELENKSDRAPETVQLSNLDGNVVSESLKFRRSCDECVDTTL